MGGSRCRGAILVPRISAGSLGVIEREIGSFIQALLRLAMIGTFGDADAAGRRDIGTIIGNCDRETLNDSAANGIYTGRSMTFGKQNDKLVATEARDAIRFARDCPQARSRFDQQCITGIMA